MGGIKPIHLLLIGAVVLVLMNGGIPSCGKLGASGLGGTHSSSGHHGHSHHGDD